MYIIIEQHAAAAAAVAAAAAAASRPAWSAARRAIYTYTYSVPPYGGDIAASTDQPTIAASTDQPINRRLLIG